MRVAHWLSRFRRGSVRPMGVPLRADGDSGVFRLQARTRGWTPGATEFYGIVQQVAEALSQERLVAQHDQVVENNGDVGGGRMEVGITLDHAAKQFCQRHGRHG